MLEQIKEKAGQSSEGEQLTWNAIWNLKKKEFDLTEELNAQIEAIKEKY